LANMKVGACKYFLNGSPKAKAGPKWNGVKGINVTLLLFCGYVCNCDSMLTCRHFLRVFVKKLGGYGMLL